MHLDLARLPDDIALLQQLVRDLAGYLDRRTAELDESKARLAVRDAEIEKLQRRFVCRKHSDGKKRDTDHPGDDQSEVVQALAVLGPKLPREPVGWHRAIG